MRPNFVPSLVGMDFMNVERQIKEMNENAGMYHLDILDWHYAENMCISPQFIQQLRPLTDCTLDVHLMVEGMPISMIRAVIEAGGDIISMHAEDVTRNIFKYISEIKGAGKKVGIVLNPAIPLSVAEYYLEDVDLVTFMGVTPGFAKQSLIPPVLDKIRGAIRLREEKGYHFTTMIDGGCHQATMKAVAETGVENIIMGATCLFSQDKDLRVAWQKMTRDFDEWTK